MWDRAQRSAAEQRRAARRSASLMDPMPARANAADDVDDAEHAERATHEEEERSRAHRENLYAQARVARDAAVRNVWIGGLICIVGIVVTAVSYSAASGGGRYVVAWGAVIFGGFRFIRGIVGYVNSPEPPTGD